MSIADIVAVSSRHNSRDDVTGLLVAGGHRYLQLIEGEPRVVAKTLARIRRDRRHVGVTVLVDRTIRQRMFARWSVAFDGEPDFGNFATLGEMVGIMRKQVGDRNLQAQLDCFSNLFVLKPLPSPPSPWTLASGYRERSFLDGGH